MVYAADAFAAIEVKRNIASRDLSGMQAFGDEYPEAAKIILYGGDHKETINGIQLILLMMRKIFPRIWKSVWKTWGISSIPQPAAGMP